MNGNMIIGLHTLLYSKDADKDRAFMRDVLGFKAVDVGEGWLIMQMPPAEMGVHPSDGNEGDAELFLMCDDVKKTISELAAKGVSCSDVQDQGWGLLTSITLPSGAKLGMYEPRHALAIATK
jgi:catechol 2,3-dioxygenase-like lactoylglutathione lyase family enzyme